MLVDRFMGFNKKSNNESRKPHTLSSHPFQRKTKACQ